ncbi:hypothetical protein RintRC_0414 [Richelia intracellularis]|nr:hypothetical protein RintRC_0414 [Richelia intracellularis]
MIKTRLSKSSPKLLFMGNQSTKLISQYRTLSTDKSVENK